MTTPALSLDRVTQLRTAFDRTFAVPPSSQAVEIEELLSIRLGGNPYALKVGEISMLTRAPKTVVVPSLVAELAGVAGIRGVIVPVFSLAAFLGYAREDQKKWCVMFPSDEPIGFAFRDFEGYLRTPRSQVYAVRQEEQAREHVKQVIRTNDIIRPIVNLQSIVELIKKRCVKKLIPEEQ